MPTDEQRALWAAIRAHPLDDTPRLVYADWLQENGDEARAEFIRLQIQLTQFAQPQSLLVRLHQQREKNALSARIERLLARNRQRWTEPFVRVIHSDVDKRDRTAVKLVRVRWGIVPFCRGFVSPYFLRPREVMRVMAADPPLEPLHAICVVAVQPDEDCSQLLSVLARSEYGPCVTGITRAGAGDDEVSAMAGECLSGLEYLSLHEGSITDTGARALAGWSSVSRTESLDLHGNRIGDSGAGALAASPYLQSAQRIFLSGNLIGPTGWRRLRDRFGTRLFGAPQD